MAEKEIGKVFSYFTNVGVAAIKLTAGLKVGDEVHIKGKTTNLTQKIKSMQIENKPIDSAKKGDDVGIKVDDRVRPNDKIYKVT
jgi:putative protease